MMRLIGSLGLAAAAVCLSSSAMAAVIPSQSRFVTSLSGKWRFRLAAAATTGDFHKLDYKEGAEWSDINVPGNWEMAGYSPATYWQPDQATGDYRTWITIPKSWAGRIVKINFDGVQNGAEIWLNGQPVSVTEPSWGRSNYHESGWTAWQADLTSAVKFGQRNLLAVRVTKATQSSDLDSGDYHFLGGIYRPITLFSVPKTHISDLTVQTHLLPNDMAQVKVVTRVSGGSANVAFQIKGLGAMQGPARDGKSELTLTVANPKLWSAEHPNLYNLQVSLKDSAGKTIEQVSRRIGIREVIVKDGKLYVNGKLVKLTGICRHDVSAEDGSAVGPTLWRKDLTLMKSANINAIRTSHYPYGSGFYDLCDEMGFYVADELPYCWCPTDTRELTPAFEQRARETIARDKNHPCVIIWAIGNENKQGRNLMVVADLVKQLDSTRPRLVSWFRADQNGVEFDDAHYTKPDAIQAAIDDKERCAKYPMIYLENPNIWDVRFGADYGCLDIWAEVIKRTWDVIWASDSVPGSFLWEWQDRAVADKSPTKLYQFDPVTGINYVKVKGLVDAYRNVRPDYYHVKMAYAPIRLEPSADFTTKPGFAILSITNRYSFTDLSELNADWRLLKDGKTAESGRAHLRLAPLSSGKVELKLPNGAANADTLRIDFDDPRGWNVLSYQFGIGPKIEPNRMLTELPDGLRFPDLNLVVRQIVNDQATWRRAYRFHGKLINVKTDPKSREGTPLLKDIRSLDADVVLADEEITPPLGSQPHDPKVQVPDPKAVVAHVHAGFTGGRFSYRIDWRAKKADVEQIGWTFNMPRRFDHLSWGRDALWSVYPDTHIGRPSGTATPDSADVHVTRITRPDAFDFNSTKYYCNWATLTDATGVGLRVEFDPADREQVRGGFGGDGYQLVVNKQCSPPEDLSSNCVPDLYLTLSDGDTMEGSYRVGSNKVE